MSGTPIVWTHNKVSIADIRKVRKFYIISIKEIDNPIFVDQTIFEARLNSYYLRDALLPGEFNSIKRNEVLDVKWNMVVTKGFFYKIDRDSPTEKIHKDPEKYYISFLEIDGPLGKYVPQ
jgi:hypothetical protein